MAQGDFSVTFGSNLPQFLSDTQEQVAALDAAIKGVGGAFADLSKIELKDIEKLDVIAKALKGDASINIDTTKLDASIRKLEATLARQLNKLGEGTGLEGASINAPDLSGVREAFKNIKVGELKRQAGFIATHVEKLREQTSESRASFLTARKEATKTTKHATAIATALDELNDSLSNAATILNQIKLEPPDATALSAAASSARATAVAAAGTAPAPAPPDVRASEELAKAQQAAAAAVNESAEATQETTRTTRGRAKAESEGANVVAEDTKVLQALFTARRDELLALRKRKYFEEEVKKPSREQKDKYEDAGRALADAQQRKAEALEKVTKAQLARFKEVDDESAKAVENVKLLDDLAQAARTLKEARQAEAEASRKAADATTQKAAEPVAQQAAVAAKAVDVDDRVFDDDIKAETERLKGSIGEYAAALQEVSASTEEVDEGALGDAFKALRELANRSKELTESIEALGGEETSGAWGTEDAAKIEALNAAEGQARRAYLASLEGLTQSQKAQVEAIDDQYRLATAVSEVYEPGIFQALNDALVGLEGASREGAEATKDAADVQRQTADALKLQEGIVSAYADAFRAAGIEPPDLSSIAAEIVEEATRGGDFTSIIERLDKEVRDAVARTIRKRAEAVPAAAPPVPDVAPAAPAEAVASEAHIKALEERASELKRQVKQARDAMATDTENMSVMEQLARVRKQELKYENSKFYGDKRRQAGTEAGEQTEANYEEALKNLAATTAERERLYAQLSQEEREIYNAARETHDDLREIIKREAKARQDVVDALAREADAAQAAVKAAKSTRTEPVAAKPPVAPTAAPAPPPEDVAQQQAVQQANAERVAAFEAEAKAAKERERAAYRQASQEKSLHEKLVSARMQELRLQATITKNKARIDKGETLNAKAKKQYDNALEKVTAATERRVALEAQLGALTEEQQAAYKREIDSRAGLWKLIEEENTARLAVAKSLAEQRKAAEAAAEAARTQAAATPATPAAPVAAAAPASPTDIVGVWEELQTLGDVASETANQVKESAKSSGKQLADGVLEAFQRLVEARRPTGREKEAMDFTKEVAQSGGKNLSASLNEALVGAISLTQRQPIAQAPTLQEIIEAEVELKGDQFVQQLTLALQDLGDLGQRDVPPEFEELALAFPDGLPEEMAQAVAERIREQADTGDSLRQSIWDALQEVASILKQPLDVRTEDDGRDVLAGRPGGATGSSAALIEGGKPQQRDYGIFGGSRESREAVDQAIRTVDDFRERVREATAQLAEMAGFGLFGDLNPLEDIPPLEPPPGLEELISSLKAQVSAAKKVEKGAETEPARAKAAAELEKLNAELRVAQTAFRSFRSQAREWEKTKLALQEMMVAFDTQRDVMEGLSDDDMALAQVRAQTLQAEKERLQSLRDEAQARREVIEAGDQALRRVSADPDFKASGRVVPSLDAQRDFPGTEDSVEFARAVDEFNKKRTEWLQSIVKVLDEETEESRKRREELRAELSRPEFDKQGVPTATLPGTREEKRKELSELEAPFTKIDAELRRLYEDLDEIYQRRNDSVEVELAAQRENLEGLKRRNAAAGAIAQVAATIAALEEQYAEIKVQQERAAKQRVLAGQVPQDPQVALGVEMMKFDRELEAARKSEMANVAPDLARLTHEVERLQKALEEARAAGAKTEAQIGKIEALEEKLAKARSQLTLADRATVDPGLSKVSEDIYAQSAQMLVAFENGVAAAERLSGLADMLHQAEADLQNVVPKLNEKMAGLADRMADIRQSMQEDQWTDDERKEGEQELKRLNEQYKLAEMEVSNIQHSFARTNEWLENTRKELERFKGAFRDQFKDRATPVRRPTGEREQLNMELRDIAAQMKRFIEALPQAARESMQRREVMRGGLELPEPERLALMAQEVERLKRALDEARAAGQDTGDMEERLAQARRDAAAEREDMKVELGLLERELRDTLAPFDELTARRSDIEASLSRRDVQWDTSEVEVTPADFAAVADQIGLALNKAIVDQLAIRFPALDRKDLGAAVNQQNLAGKGLEGFQRALEEAVVVASERAMKRLTQTTSTAALDARGGAPGAPAEPSGEVSQVVDQASVSILERIEQGIRALVECCRQMAAGLGAAPTTATQRQGAAVPVASGAEQLSLFGERIEGAANTISVAAKSSERAARKQGGAAENIIKAGALLRERLEAGLGIVFQRAEDMVIALVKDQGEKPGKAATLAAEAFGIDRVSDEFELVRLAALDAEKSLRDEGREKRRATAESRDSAKAEADRQRRLKIVNDLTEVQRVALGELIEQITDLERALEKAAKEGKSTVQIEEELLQARVKARVAARGVNDDSGVIAPGRGLGTNLAQDLIGGQGAWREAGTRLGVEVATGVRDGFQKGGAFSFIDRALQTTVQFAIRSVASRLTYGLQRQLRQLIGVGLETEATFIRVASAMEATNRSALGLRQEITRISTTLGVSLRELYELSARFTGVFDDPMDVVRATEAVALMEIISQGQLKAVDGYRALSAIQNSFFRDLEAQGKTGAEAFEFITDSTVAIQDLTGVNIEDILEGAASLGGVVEPLGFGLLETEALVAKVAQSIGQTGTAAAEQLGRIFSNVTSSRFQEELLSLNLATQAQILERDFKAIFENIAVADLEPTALRNLADIVGGDRQFRAAMALFTQAPAIVDTYTAAADSAGRADERRADLMKELANQLNILGTNVENVVATLVRSGMLNFIELLVRLANNVLSPFNRLLNVLNDLADASPFAKLIRGAIGLAAGFGVVVTAIRAMRNQLAMFFRLGSTQSATAVAGAAAGAAGAAPPMEQQRGLAAIWSRGSRGVQQVEVRNVREFRDAMRFRQAARERGESPLEVARQVREGTLREQRLRIGEVGVADVLTKSLPRRALEGTEVRLNKLTVALMKKQAALTRVAAAQATELGQTNLLVQSKVLAAKASGAMAWQVRNLTAAIGTFATFGARLGHGMVALGKKFMNHIAIVMLLGTAAVALVQHMREAKNTIMELVKFQFPKISDADDPTGMEETRNKIDEEFERWSKTNWNPFRGDFWAQAFDPANLSTPFGLDVSKPFSDLRDSWDNVVAEFSELLPDLDFSFLSGIREKISFGSGWDADSAFEAQLKGLSDEATTFIEDWRESLEEALAIEDPRLRQDALREVSEGIDPETVQDLVESERGAQRRSTALKALAELDDVTADAFAEVSRIVRGIDEYRTLSITGVERLLGVISNAQGIPPQFRDQFSEQFALLLEMEQIPEEFRDEILSLLTARTPGAERDITRILLKDALDNATANLESVLDKGGSDDERKAVTSAYQAAMSAWVSFQQSENESIIAEAEAMAEYAQAQGRSGVNELQQAISAAQRAAQGLQYGSTDWVQAQMQIRDLRRRAAEALQFEANAADDMIAELSRNPFETTQARLRQAERRLSIAQSYGDREEVANVTLEIAKLERDLAQYANDVADARFALGQAQIKDPLLRAQRATQDVVRRYREAVADGAGSLELLQLEREMVEAIDAVTQERRAIADAAASLSQSRIRNPLQRLQAATRDVIRRMRESVGEGGAARLRLQQEYEEALQAEADERLNIARAQQDFDVSKIRNPLQRATAAAQLAAQRMRQVANDIGRNSTEYISAQQDFYNAQEEIANIQRAISQAQRQTAITFAEVAHLDVQAARLRLSDARQNYREVLSLYGAYSAEAEQARAAEEQARGGLRDAILDDATSRIEWQLAMEYITQQQALAAYRNILETFELTEKQRRDIMLKMKQLQDSINSAMEGQFNLGDIRIPTPYEVRRSMGLDGIQDTVTQVVSDFTRMFSGAANGLTSGISGFSAPQTTTSINSETTVLVNGADTQEVKRILTQLLGPNAVMQVTSGSSGQRRL